MPWKLAKSKSSRAQYAQIFNSQTGESFIVSSSDAGRLAALLNHTSSDHTIDLSTTELFSVYIAINTPDLEPYEISHRAHQNDSRTRDEINSSIDDLYERLFRFDDPLANHRV